MRPAELRLAGPAILVVAGVLTLLAALMIGGGAVPRLISDPGAIVRWGLPTAKLLVNLSGGVMAGSAILALFALRAGKKEFNAALDMTSIGAAILTLSSGTTGFLTFLSSFNPQVSLGSEFGQQFGRFLLETELGQAWLITTIAAATITLLAYAFRGRAAVLIIGLLSLAALVPMATQGHSGSLANHDAAVMALVLHVTGAAVWLGGLLAVVILRPLLEETRLRIIVERYSTLALIAFIVVTVSGVARTLTSITGVGDLISTYGAVLVIKIVSLVVLGMIGVAHRRWFIRRERGEGSAFWSFVTLELAVMGLASGAAAALARTPSPADAIAPALTTPAEILTEAPLPAELTMDRWFVSWDVDLLWAMVAGFGIYFYLAGVRRLRRRGEDWTPARITAWAAGMLLLVWVTSGPISVYSDYLHSMDALGRILLVTVVPLLLVLGAPYRLALSAITIRTDGSRGIREWLQAGARSRTANFFAHPLRAACLFAASLWVTSATGVLRWTLADPLAHELRIFLLLTAGSFVMSSVIRPRRVRAGIVRTITALLVMLAPVLVAAWVTFQGGLIAADWFGAMGRTWGLDPLVDQRMAGIVLAFGVVCVGIAVAVARRIRVRQP